MSDEEYISHLKPREQERFKIVLGAALENKICPKNLAVSSLAVYGLLRIETYADGKDGGRHCRVATILVGPQASVQTRKPRWVVKNQLPIKIQDSRPVELIRELGLLAAQDLDRNKKNKKPSLEIPDWKTWVKD